MSSYKVPESQLHRIPAAYRYDYNSKSLRKIEEKYPFGNDAFIGGGSGLFSSTLDYYKFCQMLLNHGERNSQRILSKNSVELMTQDQLNSDDEISWMPGYGFGLGFAVRSNSIEPDYPVSAGEYNWTGGLTTTFWIDPAEELIGIFMTQVTPTDHDLLREIKAIVYQEIVN